MDQQTQQEVSKLLDTTTDTIRLLTKIVHDNKELVNIGLSIAALYIYSKK